MNSALLSLTFAALAAAVLAQQPATEETCNARPTLTCHLVPTMSEVAPGSPSNVRGGMSFSPFWRDNACFTRVAGIVDGLGNDTPHGIHVHELGDISASDGSSTGGHYNPFGNDHAVPGQGDRTSFHVGDLGNLFPNPEGVAVFDTLYGDPIDTWALVGRSVVIHAGTDNGRDSQPSGDAGSRVAVCVLGRLQA